MLRDYEDRKADEKEAGRELKELREQLAAQQQPLRDAKLPVVVLVEGWAAAGKGSLIGEMIRELDPRFYSVVSPQVAPADEARYPFLYPYACSLPENGKILFMDSGWMEAAVRHHLHREITAAEYKQRIRSVNEFERQLRDGGYLVLKLFLHIGREEQFERLAALREHADTEWRVTKEDLWQHREYKRFREAYEDFMAQTEEGARWHVISSASRKAAARDALQLLVKKIEKALRDGRYVGEPFEEHFPLVKMPLLKDVDLTPALTDEEYDQKLKKLQKRLKELHNVIYRRKIPVVICYEGWDAAGKGGNIRRVASPLDPRGFDVRPIASPTPDEISRQYLWRFWKRLPRSGHICIFDRTWYGRVMVERLEGFCQEKDWKRAYNEINEFERQLAEWGAVVIKFWIHIDKDTQLARFTDRQNTPEKQWKITDEDWRNREKWDLYEVAVNEMLQKTSTEFAPWHIIESNDKKYARIRTLKIIVDALEKAVADRFRLEAE